MTEKIKLTAAQKEALNLNEDQQVLAGAGSGKTRVLTERYIEILHSFLEEGKKFGVSNILVVTFTEKAAGEMRERIQKRIREKQKEESYKWERFAENFLDNQISTFHSFCASVLQSFPVESGIDPEFQIIEGFDQRQLLLNVVEWEMNYRARINDDNLKKLLTIWNRRQIQKILVQLTEKRYVLRETLRDYKEGKEVELLARWFNKETLKRLDGRKLSAFLSDLIGYSELSINERDKGIQFVRELAKFYEASRDRLESEDIWEKGIAARELAEKFLDSNKKKYKGLTSHQQVGAKKNWVGFSDEHKKVKETLQKIRDELKETISDNKLNELPTKYDRLLAGYLPALSEIALNTAERYQKEKQN